MGPKHRKRSSKLPLFGLIGIFSLPTMAFNAWVNPSDVVWRHGDPAGYSEIVVTGSAWHFRQFYPPGAHNSHVIDAVDKWIIDL